MRTDEHVRTARGLSAGRITLDRPAKYNALTLDMVRGIAAVLVAWENDPTLHAVVIDGAGKRGLCAGGDIRILYDGAGERDGRAQIFWAEEYRLNATIAGYAKPVTALMSGTVMGGGVGLSAHARHRIVTETTELAMPEANIGLIPDVGATWLLSRAPGETGTYLGLTGARIGAADAIHLGLADYFVPTEACGALVAALLHERVDGDDAIRSIVRRYAAFAGKPRLAEQRTSIDRAFAHDTVEEIVHALLADGSPFALSAARQIAANSPTSVKLTLRALREASTYGSLEECLRLEYRLMSRLLDGHDFCEGTRAAIVDKDRAPKWSPAQLGDVSVADVDSYFISLRDGELEI
jgi:enoyl-CoA hydratase